MRSLVLVLMVLGCSDPIDAASDASSSGSAGSAFDRGLHLPVGATCAADDSFLCAAGRGVCIDSVCRSQCYGAQWPRCPAGSTEQRANFPLPRGYVCWCAAD